VDNKSCAHTVNLTVNYDKMTMELHTVSFKCGMLMAAQKNCQTVKMQFTI